MSEQKKPGYLVAIDSNPDYWEWQRVLNGLRKRGIDPGKYNLPLGAEKLARRLGVDPGNPPDWNAIDEAAQRWADTLPQGNPLAMVMPPGIVDRLAEIDAPDPKLWAPSRWITKKCQVTSDDLRQSLHQKPGEIRTRPPKSGKQKEFYLPDVVRAFPAKAPALVNKFLTINP
jgi:hypothetical protein